MKPYRLPGEYFCGNDLPGFVYVSGHSAIINLNTMLIGGNYTVDFAYQCIGKYHVKLKDKDIELSFNIREVLGHWEALGIFRAVDALRINNMNIIIWRMTTYLMSRIQVNIRFVCDLSDTSDISLMLVDGQMPSFDAIFLFQSQHIYLKSSDCQNNEWTNIKINSFGKLRYANDRLATMYTGPEDLDINGGTDRKSSKRHYHNNRDRTRNAPGGSQQTGFGYNSWTSKLNDFTVILFRSIQNTWRTDITVKRSPTCSGPSCQKSVHYLYNQEFFYMDIVSRYTSARNITYILERSATYQMALRILSVSFHGHYTSGCSYGSVTLAYKDSLYRSRHTLLGTYCSPGALAGLRSVADPLYLEKGSLSIIIKTYHHVTEIRLRYRVERSHCSGIVNEYFMQQYSGNNIHEYPHHDSPHYVVNKPRLLYSQYTPGGYQLMQIPTLSYTISRISGNCVYFQYITHDVITRTLMDGYHNPFISDFIFRSHADIDSGYSYQSHTTTYKYTFSKYTIRVSDPNKIIQHSYCSVFHPYGYDGINLEMDDNARRRHLAPVLFDQSSIFDGIIEVKYTGIFTTCLWSGLNMRIGIDDSNAACQRRYYPSVFHLIPVQCSRFRLFYSEHSPGEVLNEQERHFVRRHSFNVMYKLNDVHEAYWCFFIDSLSHHTLKLSYVMYSIEGTHHHRPGLDNVSVFVVYYNRIDVLHTQTTYFIVEDYLKSDVDTYVAPPTYHGSGMFLTSARDACVSSPSRCTMDISYQHYYAHPYTTPLNYQTVTFNDEHPGEVNQWRMCRHQRCYMVRDEDVMPGNSTWSGSESFCNINGGHLWSVNSDAEQLSVIQWLINKRRDTSNSGYSKLYLRASVLFIGLQLNKVRYICIVVIT